MAMSKKALPAKVLFEVRSLSQGSSTTKYLYKHIYKGKDRTTMVTEGIGEKMSHEGQAIDISKKEPPAEDRRTVGVGATNDIKKSSEF